ncbi:hypothetical protein B0H12DRAFT_1241314 [Mycena haematopus]|nr:hypothetical protein B0H12DRAFT_1241314 [Mycena haematopus]
MSERDVTRLQSLQLALVTYRRSPTGDPHVEHRGHQTVKYKNYNGYDIKLTKGASKLKQRALSAPRAGGLSAAPFAVYLPSFAQHPRGNIFTTAAKRTSRLIAEITPASVLYAEYLDGLHSVVRQIDRRAFVLAKTRPSTSGVRCLRNQRQRERGEGGGRANEGRERESGAERVSRRGGAEAREGAFSRPRPNATPNVCDARPRHTRRRSCRLSMSWRTAPSRSTSGTLPSSKSTLSIPDDLEWEQELFQRFLDFQVDYASLERRLLDQSLREIISSDTRDQVPGADRARLLRERAVDVFSVVEESVGRCTAFTHGYGAVGLVQALDGFFQSFIDMWTADVRLGYSSAVSMASQLASGEDLSGLDYTAEEWADSQLSLHLLSSARPPCPSQDLSCHCRMRRSANAVASEGEVRERRVAEQSRAARVRGSGSVEAGEGEVSRPR